MKRKLPPQIAERRRKGSSHPDLLPFGCTAVDT
jgi:hypothetical protein